MNQYVERIDCGTTCRETLALIVYGWRVEDGIRFLTEPEDPLQLGCMRRPVGHLVAPHEHRFLPRAVHRTAEVLFIRSGRVRLSIFGNDLDDTGSYLVTTRELRGGDVALLFAGGHGLEVLEEAEIWEVKQGPHLGDADKRKLCTTHSANTDAYARGENDPRI